MSSWPARLRRDLVPVLLVGVLVFQLLRNHVCERYRVTSRSMEPTLHGHPETGDVVLVDRTAWNGDMPRPLDLVVVRNRDNPDENHLVKRFLAAGPVWVRFDHGDVYFGDERWQTERFAKDPVAHRGLRLTHREFPTHGVDFLQADASRWSRAADGSLRLEAVDEVAQLVEPTTTNAQDRRSRAMPADPFLPGHLSLAAAVGPEFFDGQNRPIPSGGPLPRDLGLELDARVPAGCRSVQLVFEFAEVYFALRIEPETGSGELAIYGESQTDFRVPARQLPCAIRLEFGYLDGRFFLVIDDALAFEHPFELPRESRLRIDRDGRLRNCLHVGVAGAEIRIDRMRVFRDTHYDHHDPEPFLVESGRIFVLGDNAYDSSDSRDRMADPFEVSDLLGRPCAIIGPYARRRWLPRYGSARP